MGSSEVNELYRLAVEGDGRAEEELFKYLTARFRLFTRQRVWIRVDADEIVQEALMAILGEYKSLVIDTSFAAWAYKVLDNRILAYIKNRGRTRDRFADMDSEGERTPGIETRDVNDLKRRLSACLKKICASNIRYSRILNLHYQGYAAEEICAKLGITRTNYYSILSRARSLLEICLEKGDIES